MCIPKSCGLLGFCCLEAPASSQKRNLEQRCWKAQWRVLWVKHQL